MVGGMADVLAEVDPPHAADYKRGGHAYAARLRKLSDWCVARLSSLPVKKVVVYHPAFGYLFRKCGLQVLGALETSPGREASTSELVDIVRKMKQENSQVIFVEPQFSFKLAQVLADETGARLVTLDDIGDPADPRRDTYVHLMEYNVAQVVAALGGKTGPPPDL
jgi:zinc transport system substrate-binding protein